LAAFQIAINYVIAPLEVDEILRSTKHWNEDTV
jgi:hypothetical protein